MGIIDELKAMRNRYRGYGKKKLKPDIRTLGKAIKRIEQLEDELEKAKQIDMGLNV